MHGCLFILCGNLRDLRENEIFQFWHLNILGDLAASAKVLCALCEKFYLTSQEVTSTFSPILIVEPSVKITDCGVCELRILNAGSNCWEKSTSTAYSSTL